MEKNNVSVNDFVAEFRRRSEEDGIRYKIRLAQGITDYAQSNGISDLDGLFSSLNDGKKHWEQKLLQAVQGVGAASFNVLKEMAKEYGYNLGKLEQ